MRETKARKKRVKLMEPRQLNFAKKKKTNAKFTRSVSKTVSLVKMVKRVVKSLLLVGQ